MSDLEARFWKNVDWQIDISVCWPWRGPAKPHGYGVFNCSGKKLLAHRFAAEISKGPAPDGMCVCHHCDNPPCCNPAHLFYGTQTENVADCVLKGRHKNPTFLGERNPQSLLDADQVMMIRCLLDLSIKQAIIADAYGVKFQTISKIGLRQSWRHL